LEFDRQLDLIQIREFRKTGDLQILGSLYEKYMHLVYGVCMHYLNNRENARDAVIQIFEKLAIECVKQEIGHFRSWLYVVSKNHCLFELRKQKVEDQHARKWKEDEWASMENEDELHPLDKEERFQDLDDCLRQLKQEQRDSITLFYYRRMCYREIARTLKTDEKKVKSHIQNGKRNLKICLDSKNDREA